MVVRFFGLNKARRGSISAGICNREATQLKPKSGATRRARALWDVWRRCSLLTDPCGYARRSRLAIRPKLLLRGQLLFMRWLLELCIGPPTLRLRRDSPESFRGWRQGDYAPASDPIVCPGALLGEEVYRCCLTNARPDAVFRYRSNIAARERSRSAT